MYGQYVETEILYVTFADRLQIHVVDKALALVIYSLSLLIRWGFIKKILSAKSSF